ncbi:glutathione S-transferase family protein [Hydrogenophaga sp.]|uniref:glutathione S-transferase family protein n=1 Tax=Hydrogenophaga sp. TaxID=1904254 RepID=UPI003D0D6E68
MTNANPASVPTLFYSPNACSLASHIALEETGTPYRAVETLLSAKAHLTPEYLAINPRGKVPALIVEQGVITENTAILTYIATTHPQAGLLPTDAFQQALCIAQMAWFSNTPHIYQRAKFRPYYFADDESLHPGIRAKAEASFWKSLQEIDGLLAGRRWMMGDGYTVVDPYALVFYGWGVSNRMPMEELKDYTRHKNQMLQRPAVKTVLEREKNPHIR